MNKDNINIVDVDFEQLEVEETGLAPSGTHRAGNNPATMLAFWTVIFAIWKIGKFLARPIGKGTDALRLADVLAAGKTVRGIKSIKAFGHVLPIEPAFDLSIATVKYWGCPACQSAHGTGIGSSGSYSKLPNADNLAFDNDFYYIPSQQRIVTISKTCYKHYVKGMDMESRIYIPSQEEVKTFLASLASPASAIQTRANELLATEAPATEAPAEPKQGRNRRSA